MNGVVWYCSAGQPGIILGFSLKLTPEGVVFSFLFLFFSSVITITVAAGM